MTWASDQAIGIDGMRGMPFASAGFNRLPPSRDGQPGVVGSPGPSERNWTLPRWIASDGRPWPRG